MTATFVDVDNARLPEQRQVMQTIEAAAECPFCPANLAKYHKQPILFETPHWLVTTNQWPYEHTRFHFLAMTRDHLVHLKDLPAVAGAELIEIVQRLAAEYDLPGGGLVIRFGETNYSAGTVNHLHAQLIVPEITGSPFEPVRIKLGKKITSPE